jgi:hypothetical protein
MTDNEVVETTDDSVRKKCGKKDLLPHPGFDPWRGIVGPWPVDNMH